MTPLQRASMLALLLAPGCGGDAFAGPVGGTPNDVVAEPEDAAVAEPPVAPREPPFEPPSLSPPAPDSTDPYYLVQAGLYVDAAQTELAPDLIEFAPRFALWSDGAEKRRWLRLPRGTTIDTRDPDRWQLPVGAVLFKEFARDGRRLETRVIARLGPGPDDFFMGAFVWRADQTDAELTREGARDVLGTTHDVPGTKSCGTCHNGEPGRVLGLSMVQQPDLPATALSTPLPNQRAVPFDPNVTAALGYLHANCGHCHNPTGSARPDTDMDLRLTAGASSPEQTTIYQSTLGVKLQYFDGDAVKLRVMPGVPAASGLLVRMQQRGKRVQMPPLASELVDEEGVALVRRWISELPRE